MGYIRHHAIIITSYDLEAIYQAARKATLLRLPCSNVVPYQINSGASFAVLPDGSKEGWDESNRSNDARDALVEWLKDRTDFYEWVEVSFAGDDSNDTKVTRHSSCF